MSQHPSPSPWRDITRDLTPTRPYKARPLRDVTNVHIHHTATSTNATPASLHAAHIRRGWSGLAYHLLAYCDGTLLLTRPLSTLPASVAGHNRHAVAVAFVGNLDAAPPTDAALRAVAAAILAIERLAGRRLNVTPHRDLHPTACPGRLFPGHRLLAMLRSAHDA